jgi:two-component system NarL family sensor kinase
MQEITGEIKIVLAITLLLLLITSFVILFLFFYQKRYYQHKKEKEELQSQFAQTLLQSQIEIQEQTLQHIGRELHDNLGQIASLIKINLNTLQLSDMEKAVDKIENTKDLTRQLITDIKSLSVSLGSDRITQTGLAKGIEIEMDRLNKTGQFTATYQLLGPMPAIDNDKAIILYRMTQEVLNNIVKHSKAKQIDISLHSTDKLFILACKDDGVGFNVDEKRTASGAGLRNLKSRAQLIDARLNIQSTPGIGSLVTIELPL